MQVAQEKSFKVGGVKFSAIRKTAPIPHWVFRLDETGEVFQSGTAGISNKSVPKMIESFQYLLSRIHKGDAKDFRKGFGLPPQAPAAAAPDGAAKPIKTDMVFATVPGELGLSWTALCEGENELAEKLRTLPFGTAAVHGESVWFLYDYGDHLALCHGQYVNGVVSNTTSRFDFDLQWVDLEEDEISVHAQLVRQVVLDFNTVYLPQLA